MPRGGGGVGGRVWSISCERCGRVCYCSLECRHDDWPRHQGECQVPSYEFSPIPVNNEGEVRLQANREERLHELQDYEDGVVVRVKQGANYACATCQRRTTLDGKALRKCGRCLTERYCSVECQTMDLQLHSARGCLVDMRKTADHLSMTHNLARMIDLTIEGGTIEALPQHPLDHGGVLLEIARQSVLAFEDALLLPKETISERRAHVKAFNAIQLARETQIVQWQEVAAQQPASASPQDCLVEIAALRLGIMSGHIHSGQVVRSSLDTIVLRQDLRTLMATQGYSMATRRLTFGFLLSQSKMLCFGEIEAVQGFRDVQEAMHAEELSLDFRPGVAAPPEQMIPFGARSGSMILDCEEALPFFQRRTTQILASNTERCILQKAEKKTIAADAATFGCPFFCYTPFFVDYDLKVDLRLLQLHMMFADYEKVLSYLTSIQLYVMRYSENLQLFNTTDLDPYWKDYKLAVDCNCCDHFCSGCEDGKCVFERMD